LLEDTIETGMGIGRLGILQVERLVVARFVGKVASSLLNWLSLAAHNYCSHAKESQLETRFGIETH